MATDFLVKRSESDGGDIEYANYEELEAAFENLSLHPSDLKGAVETKLNELLEPIREIFQRPENAKLIDAAYPAPSKAKAAVVEDTPALLDIRVGKIVEVKKHPEADALYIEKIDLGMLIFLSILVSLCIFFSI